MLAMIVSVAVTIGRVDEPKNDGPKPPSKEVLAAIETRGKLLAEYDRAAWHASDAVQAQRPRDGSIEGYVALKTDKGWLVSFGRLDPPSGDYLVAYEATEGANPEAFQVRAFEPPKKGTDFEKAATRGLAVALKEFMEHSNVEKRPYNFAVLPADGKKLWLYLYPAQTRANVWPLGSDVRYTLSADGSKILEKRPLHKAIIEFETPAAKKPENELAAHLHNHILSELPEDTDVFHVLSRKPSTREVISTPNFVFGVEPDGSLVYLGLTAELFKK